MIHLDNFTVDGMSIVKVSVSFKSHYNIIPIIIFDLTKEVTICDEHTCDGH